MRKGNLKKVLSIFLSFLMVLGLCAVSVPEKANAAGKITFTVSADKQELKRGDEVTITVTMSGNTEAYGITYELLHDKTKLELTEVMDLPATGSVIEGLNPQKIEFGGSNETVDDTAMTTVARTQGAVSNGIVLKAKYRVKDDAAAGTAGIDSDVMLAKEDASSITDFTVNDNTGFNVVVPATGISLNKTSVVIAKGQSEQLTATLTPAGANSPVQWKSSRSSVATVTQDGTVTAVTTGKTTITATANGKSASCEVTVNNPLNGITITSAGGVTTIKKGQSTQLNVSYDPADTTDDKTVTWTSSKESVATVSNTGLVTAVADGTTTITASVGSKTASYEITVQEVRLNGISLNKSTATVHRGEQEVLTVVYDPENTTDDKTVTWKTSDATKVSVDGNGKITAKAVGGAVITARVGNHEAACTVTVDAPLSEIIPEKTTLTLLKNQTATISYTLNPSDTTDSRDVTFSSSDTEVVTVDSATGNLTALKAGTAVITLTGANHITASVEVTVKEIPIDQVVLNKKNLTIEKNASAELIATVGPENTTDDDTTVTWSSSDESIATVAPSTTASGSAATITATGKGGKVTITATAGNGKKASCEVTVPIHIESIKIADPGEIVRGGTKVAEVTYNPADTTDDTKVTWSSDNEEVATVDSETGMITAVREGTANITATTTKTAAPVSDTIQITVKENHLNENLGSNIAFDELKDALLKGQKINMNEYLNLKKIVEENQITDDISIEWSVSDASVGETDQNGCLTGLQAGKTNVKAVVTARDGNGQIVGTYEAETEVTVREVALESVAFNKVIKEMVVGATDLLEIIYNPADTTDVRDVEWSSSDPSVLSVENGKLTAKKAGTAEITAKVGDKSVSCTILVKENVSDKGQTAGNKKNNADQPGEAAKKAAKTGDTFNMTFYILLLFISMGAVIVSGKRKNRWMRL